MALEAHISHNPTAEEGRDANSNRKEENPSTTYDNFDKSSRDPQAPKSSTSFQYSFDIQQTDHKKQTSGRLPKNDSLKDATAEEDKS